MKVENNALFVLAADRNRTKGDANEMKLRPWKRVLSLVLAFALVFAMPCVTSVYADDIPLYYLDSGGEVKEVPETTQLLDTGASVWGTEGTETWYYLKNDSFFAVDGLQQDVTVSGDVHLILDNSASYHPMAYLKLQDGVCLTIPSGSSLTIYTKKPEYVTQIPGMMDVSFRNGRGSAVKVEKGGTLRVVSGTLRSVGINTISGTGWGTIDLDGTLIVEDSGTLIVTRSGVMEVHEGGEVIVQDGGSFDLQTRKGESARGGICYLDGTVTVEPGGNLFFGPNSFMYLNPTGYLDVEDPENIEYEENGNGCIILADNNRVSENILETIKDYTRYFINGIQLEGYEDASPHITLNLKEMTTFTVHIQSEGENPYYTIQFLNISGLFQIRSVNPCAGNTFQFTLSSDLLFEDDPFTLSVKLYNKETGGYLLDVVTLDMTADCIQPVTGVTLDQTALSLTAGETATLTAAVLPEDASNKTVTWSSSNPDVAAVTDHNDGTASVTAGSAGTATLTATAADGSGVSASCAVEVTQPAAGVTLDRTALSLTAGETATLTAAVLPEDASDKTVTWSSSNPDVAAVTDHNDGTASVTAGSAGTATITAVTEDGGYTAACTVEVARKSASRSGSEPSVGSPLPSAGTDEEEPGSIGPDAGESGSSGQSGSFTQPAGCVSDTVGAVDVSGAYQFRFTSTNGTPPAVELDSPNFRAVLVSQEGNDYFYKVYAVGQPGQQCTVTVNGTTVAQLTASAGYGGVISDTTAPFSVAAGGSYQFRLTADTQPAMTAGSPSFTVESVGNEGRNWFFKVYAVGKPGDGCGFYVNGAPVPVAVAHIS